MQYYVKVLQYTKLCTTLNIENISNIIILSNYQYLLMCTYIRTRVRTSNTPRTCTQE